MASPGRGRKRGCSKYRDALQYEKSNEYVWDEDWLWKFARVYEVDLDY